MLAENRVVVTGVGIVSPLGIGRQEFWSALARGCSGVKELTLFQVDSGASRKAAEITNFDPQSVLGKKGLRLLDRTTRLTLCAAKLALDDAGYEISGHTAASVGVVLGSFVGSLKSRSDFYYEAIKGGPRSVNPALFPNTVVNSPASQVSIRFGITGFNATITNGFTSSLEAVDYAVNMIRSGRAQAVLAGGTEELAEASFWALSSAGLLSRDEDHCLECSRPYDRGRNGFVFGEGSAILFLENLEHARSRGARILGEYKGGAFSTDQRAYKKYSYRMNGSEVAIKNSLLYSRLNPEDIGWVAAGANSSLVGDAGEGRVLQRVFGRGGARIMAPAIKSMIGETASAAGAFQIAAALLGLAEGTVPPTINVVDFDDRCWVDCLPGDAREMHADNVLVHNFSPLCQSAAAVISRYTA